MHSSKITSIIAHVDHGKTTLIDSIIASTGYFSKSLAGSIRYLDNRKDEQEREITMKLSPIKLENGHVFIDTPGHVDFENLLFSSSILSDNHIILVDVNEGITPRTYSLIKFINKKRCVLVLNKIDKCTDFGTVELALMQINGLFGEEIFEWAKNNVIISCSTLGAGISCKTFKFSSKNTLRQAFRAFKALDAKIDNKDVSEIMKKYSIGHPSKKIIISTVMPLHEAIFSTEDLLNNDADLNEISKNELLNFNINDEFFNMSFENKPVVCGITTYGKLKNKDDGFKRRNVLLLMKVFWGKISTGEKLYSCSENETRLVLLEGIYDFNIDEYIHRDSFEGPGLIYIEGDFLRNSVISTEPAVFSFKKFPVPFFSSKLILKDLERLDEMKAIIRVMAFTEQNLKVTLNRFSEFEFKCGGFVQLEKICHDLKDNGFEIIIKKPKMEFRELTTKVVKGGKRNEDTSLELILGPIALLDDRSAKEMVGCERIETAKNVYYIDSEKDRHVIESVLNIFTASGPLINECITDTCFCIKSNGSSDISFFSTLKKMLSDLYMETAPTICPLFFSLLFSVSRAYTPSVYLSLQKNFYILESEEYNEENDFVLIRCKVPQYTFNDLIEEAKVRTKGTVYVEFLGSEYLTVGDFSQFVDTIRKDKGLFIGEKIVEDPEKQRTLKR